MGKEKKEIGIEKLIELLNEYNEIHNYAPIEYYDDEADGFETNYVAFYKTCIIISKKFGFIKWLVENDKIDGIKFYGENEFTPIGVNAKSDIDQVYSIEEQILMVLSISDTPIEDLCRYLKDDATEKVDTLLKGIKKSCESLGI